MSEQDEQLIAFGGEIKSFEDGKVGGYLIVYGDPQSTDLEGDYFTKNTAIDFEDGDRRPVYFNHGLDAKMGKRRIGYATLRRDEFGIWAEAQIELRDEYERFIAERSKMGKMGWSSGSAKHLTEREFIGRGKVAHIKSWAIAEASITPIPAEPRAGLSSLKSLTIPPDDDEAPETEPDASDDAVTVDATPHIEIVSDDKSVGEGEMPEENTERMDALEGNIKGVSEQLNRVLSMLETAPAQSLGYVSADGGAADKNIKSLGDYLSAVQRKDSVRLEKVYGSSYKTTMTEGAGSTGGYAVPTEFSTMLLQAAEQASQIYARVMKLNVSAPTGRMPYLDTFTAPTAGVGQTAQAGKVTTAKRTEAAAYTETNAEFEQLEYRINDIASGLIRVSRELRADSAIMLEQLLTRIIRTAVAAKMEYYILRGSGVGEPLGILNAPALVQITPDTNSTFAYLDAVEMTTRFKAVGSAPAWITHQGLLLDVAAFQVAASSPVTWTQDLGAQLRGTLLGYPLLTSEHSPNPTTSGCALLADLGAYIMFLMGDMYVDFSSERYFDTGEDAWRFGIRADGRPWWKGAETLASPSAFTVSPFVSFND